MPYYLISHYTKGLTFAEINKKFYPVLAGNVNYPVLLSPSSLHGFGIP